MKIKILLCCALFSNLLTHTMDLVLVNNDLYIKNRNEIMKLIAPNTLSQLLNLPPILTKQQQEKFRTYQPEIQKILCSNENLFIVPNNVENRINETKRRFIDMSILIAIMYVAAGVITYSLMSSIPTAGHATKLSEIVLSAHCTIPLITISTAIATIIPIAIISYIWSTVEARLYAEKLKI